MNHSTSRRRFLRTAAVLLPAAYLSPVALASVGEARRLQFRHTHTGENLDVVYHEHGAYVPDALSELNHLLRDFRSGDIAEIDPTLFDTLYAAQQRLGSKGAFEIISGYRSPATNEMLRQRSGGVAKRSLHMQGKAIDVRLTDAATRDLRQVALDLARGGVGYYAKSDFVHLDTGRVRWW